MHEIDWTWCPRVAAHEITRIFLLSQARLQKARQTLEAYGRDLDDLLEATASRPLSDLIKFKALQRRAYQVDGKPAQRLALSWSPDELLATPENIRRQRIPNPRNLDHGWWQKLTWAAATLSAKDLSANHAAYLPLVYYRAVDLLWVTGARRSDEIRRLKVGCVSREWAAQMRDEEGKQLEPEEDLCYVRVPVNKLQREFWAPIPTYTADAIEAWERLRPKLQDARIDRKENKPTDYLFLMRDQLMGRDFLNRSVIPLLCKAAGLVDEHGVPLRDATGRLTLRRWNRRSTPPLLYTVLVIRFVYSRGDPCGCPRGFCANTSSSFNSLLYTCRLKIGTTMRSRKPLKPTLGFIVVEIST